MQRLIPSLEPFYDAMTRLCQQSKDGIWKGDIFAVRNALGRELYIEGQEVTRKLTSLQSRGLLTFTVDKPRHKRLIWTVTIKK